MTARAKKESEPAKRVRPTAEPTVAASYARALARLAAAKGADEAALLARAKIDPRELDDPDNRVPLAKFVTLMREGKALSGNDALALHFGEAFDIGELSIVGLIGQSCETTGEAFAQLNRLARLVVEVDSAGGNRLTLVRDARGVWLVDGRTDPNDFPEMTESSFARMACTARRTAAPGLICEVHVTHAAPAHRSEYDRIFQTPVVFGSDKNALLLANDDWLTHKMARLPGYLFGILSERAELLMKRLELSKTFRGRVESALIPDLHKGNASLDRIAGQLGVSTRTLSRRLNDEGVTFATVLDDLRHKLAIYYLNENKVTVSETAYLVGFSERAAFTRAFKRWTGSIPRNARTRRARS